MTNDLVLAGVVRHVMHVVIVLLDLVRDVRVCHAPHNCSTRYEYVVDYFEPQTRRVLAYDELYAI